MDIIPVPVKRVPFLEENLYPLASKIATEAATTIINNVSIVNKNLGLRCSLFINLGY